MTYKSLVVTIHFFFCFAPVSLSFSFMRLVDSCVACFSHLSDSLARVFPLRISCEDTCNRYLESRTYSLNGNDKIMLTLNERTVESVELQLSEKCQRERSEIEGASEARGASTRKRQTYEQQEERIDSWDLPPMSTLLIMLRIADYSSLSHFLKVVVAVRRKENTSSALLPLIADWIGKS